MTATAPTLETLKRHRPEWAPWLSVVEAVQPDLVDTRWDDAVPEGYAGATEPMLSGTTIELDGRRVRRFVDRLLDAACRSGASRISGAGDLLRRETELGALVRASITQDPRNVDELAAARDIQSDALQAIVSLVALPLLHACRRRWVTSPGWTQGYCPVCGSWPAFAEVRGIERTRYLRCARCGGEWHAHVLHCAYCGTTEHDELVTLIADGPSPRTVEACRQCHGYLKSLTKLQGTPPAAVMLEDLAAVDLDIAALEHGFARPAGAGSPPRVIVHVTDVRQGIFGWTM